MGLESFGSEDRLDSSGLPSTVPALPTQPPVIEVASLLDSGVAGLPLKAGFKAESTATGLDLC